MQKFERYHDAFSYILSLLNIPSDRDYMGGKVRDGVYLLRMRWFLNLLGNPDRGMKYVHITGTSGKSSVTTLVYEMIRASGKKVGTFRSPFMISAIEDIEVNGLYIAPDEFADLVDYLKPFLDRAHVESPYGMPSYFEIFFMLSILYFKQKKCDWVVLEVGLGGRYDATNVIEKPAVTAITNIDYDHTEILGKTLSKITLDKAGIIKAGATFFTTEPRPQLLKIFRNVCAEENVPMRVLEPTLDYHEANTMLATAIARYIGTDGKSIERGIKNTKLPCRLEVMQKKPLVILDGAHNRAKMRTTAENISKLKYKKMYLILGTKATKDSESIVESIIPLADHVYVTRFQLKGMQCTSPKELALLAKKYLKKGAKLEVLLDSKQALEKALASANPDDCVLATGSFYLVGELRKRWYSEEKVLTRRKSF